MSARRMEEVMLEKDEIVLKDGFIFDYSTMFGDQRIQKSDIEDLRPRMHQAAEALKVMRQSGYARAHLSKNGEPEHVYFTRLPYVQDGNPNSPESISHLEDFQRKVQEKIDAVIFLGVGGSYLGNKVLFDVFCGDGWNNLSDAERNNYPRVFFSGNNIDPRRNKHIVKQIKSIAAHTRHKKATFDLLLVPISKSGTTLETLTAFSYYYSEFSNCEDIVLDVAVVTDLRPEIQSPLYVLAEEHGWRKFDVKEGIGGRFSVLNDVGFVTAAAIGLNIEQFLVGARAMDEACQGDDEGNPALLNATLKYLAGSKYGCDMEVFMGYGNDLKSLGEWYVQLLAESLGKRKNREGEVVYYGRTPIAAIGSMDMHAQTQQHQDGKRNKVIQFLQIDQLCEDINLENPFPHIHDFAKYAGVSLNRALDVALLANREALTSDNRFTALYKLPKLNEFYMGQMFYFLMLSIAYEGELADVNAFDQPGVEAYKRIIKRELGK